MKNFSDHFPLLVTTFDLKHTLNYSWYTYNSHTKICKFSFENKKGRLKAKCFTAWILTARVLCWDKNSIIYSFITHLGRSNHNKNEYCGTYCINTGLASAFPSIGFLLWNNKQYFLLLCVRFILLLRLY